VRPWCGAVPMSPANFYKQLKADKTLRENVVKVGAMTIVRESPSDYLDRKAREQQPGGKVS
jgi:hypothetical protein